MYSTQALTNNLESILQTALEAGAYSVSESASNLNDEEDRRYFFNLRKGVMECLTAVVAGISDCKMSNVLDNKLDPMLEFLNSYFGTAGFNSNFEDMKMAAGIIGDMCQMYKSEGRGNVLKEKINKY